MRNSVILCLFTVLLAVSCTENAKKADNSQDTQNDSIMALLAQKDEALNRLTSVIGEIQDGFNAINAAEGRITEMSADGAEGEDAVTHIREDMEFIQTTLAQNRQKIAELEQRLRKGGSNVRSLKEMVANLNEQLESKSKDIEELRAQLAERDVKIEELDASVNELKETNARVSAENETNAQIARNQDRQLNTAYYVYGTSRELKAHNIISSGDVLCSADYDENYFIRIDIRETTVIPLGSKSAKILTQHPAGSYTLLKDAKGEYTLRITDPSRFWSNSKRLVIKVK